MELADRKAGITQWVTWPTPWGFSGRRRGWDENGHFDCFAAPVIDQEKIRVVNGFDQGRARD